MEGTIIHVANRYVVVTPAFPPMSILKDDRGNVYLVVSTESMFDRYVVKALDALRDVAADLQSNKINVDLAIMPENMSKAVLIGRIVVYPRAGDKVYLMTTMDELTSDRDVMVTPFGEFDPWAKRTGHVTIFGRSGVGKSLSLLALILRTVQKGLKAVVLDFHGEYREAVEDFLKRGYKAIYYDVPKINICRAQPEVLAALFGILPVLDKAPKMYQYMQRIAQLACKAPPEIKAMFDSPVDLLRAIAEVIIMLPTLDESCGIGNRVQKLDVGRPEEPECRILRYIYDSMRPFEYKLLKNLLKERDRESVESLYRYMEALNAFRDIVSLDEDIVLEGYDIVFVNLSVALSHISYAIPIAIYVIDKVFNSPEKIVLFVEEAPALMQSERIKAAIENLVRQGRKFWKFVVIVTQVPLEIMAQTSLLVGNIANQRYIKEVLSRLPHMSDALRYILPLLPPWHFIYISHDGDIIPVKIVRKPATHSASEA